ncbi:helix-turn-helix domain protein [Ruminiclostridium hungatei]|uniref:Helix-turn-helix domain protein n=1 Tax=Ruminiclostridium hungatei TaxID=48256 RepID=A0A1V4SR27_RUMHU|nr:helix-turn-helix transcriptional regulator [Ruminiclostridium hungatei]OPX46330.1 helix-turn-helix domain protein [Ruminiclostridium hungatei]
MTTAEKIKSLREIKGYSQINFAKKTKVFTQSQICKIENGNRKITDTDLSVLAQALGVSITELIGDVCSKKKII